MDSSRYIQKHQEFQNIEKEIQQMRIQNGQIFAGGYTESAKRSYDAQEINIARIEKEKKDEHSKRWDHSSKQSMYHQGIFPEKTLDVSDDYERLTYYKRINERPPRWMRVTSQHVDLFVDYCYRNNCFAASKSKVRLAVEDYVNTFQLWWDGKTPFQYSWKHGLEIVEAILPEKMGLRMIKTKRN